MINESSLCDFHTANRIPLMDGGELITEVIEDTKRLK